jgi:hypothetical protein
MYAFIQDSLNDADHRQVTKVKEQINLIIQILNKDQLFLDKTKS